MATTKFTSNRDIRISPLLASADLMWMQGQVVAAASSVRSGDVQGNGRMRAGLG
jgi:hypothetical protein